LDYTTNNTNKFAGALFVDGGDIEITPNGSADTVQSATSTTLSTGSGTITVNKNGGNNNSTLNLNVISRTAGTLNVAYGGAGTGTAKLTTDNANSSGGILGGWATFGNDWAINSSGGADGRIEAFGGYTPVATGVDIPDDSTKHVLISSASTGNVGLAATTTNI